MYDDDDSIAKNRSFLLHDQALDLLWEGYYHENAWNDEHDEVAADSAEEEEEGSSFCGDDVVDDDVQ